MKVKLISLSLLVVLSISCQNEILTPNDDIATIEGIEKGNNGLPATANSKKNSSECNVHCDNCTLYVACKLRTNGFSALGKDCSTYQAKLSIINTGADYIPRWGDVAIFDTGTEWGHMAFVEWVSPWTGQIFISEANWNGNCISWRQNGRRAAYEAVGLQGFYHP